MLPSLECIKKRREKLGIQQKQLAQMCDIKPAMLSMIENGSAKPSYDVWAKIESTLDKEEGKFLDNLMTAGQICTKNIPAVKKKDLIKDAASIMNRRGLSQLIVLQSEPVGMITETTIFQHLVNHNGYFNNGQVQEAIVSLPPVVDWDYKITPRLMQFLVNSECIMVSKNNNIDGVITKNDVIRGTIR